MANISLFVNKNVSHVTKFDGSNFTMWKFHIHLLFEQHEHLQVVLGTDKEPAPIMATQNGQEVMSNADVIKM